ncbi:MAG: hypothetical protein ABR920_12185 [Terriglobales bacterium]
MGYNLHITRRKNWSEEGNDISAQEWLTFINNDPEPTLSNENGQYFVRWSGPSKLPDPGFDWHNGVICSKNPDHI